MIKTLFAAAAAIALTATPAVAAPNDNFVGPRIEVQAGLDDVRNTADFNDVVYGAAAGFDLPLGDRGTFGVEGTVRNPFDDTGREFGVGARLGVAIAPRALAFGRVGYSTVDLTNNVDLEGLNVGGGLNLALTPNLYTNVEYRYSDFDHGVGSHGALVGLGLRF